MKHLTRTIHVAGDARLRADNKRLRDELALARAALARAEQDAQQELAAFVSATNHDLRAPLRHIELFSQILIEDHAASLPASAVEGLGHLHGSSKKLGIRLDALVNLLRQTNAALTPTTIDLAALLRERILHVASHYPGHRVAWDSPDACWVEADREMLTTALDQLIDNAWKFTSRHPEPAVHITLAADQDGCALLIRDNGVGFEPRYASRLGTPFRRLHAEGSFPGIGLGLAAALRIIRRHHGALTIDAILQGGVTLTLRLPTLRTSP
jgi:signal transduction histidine kinase